MNYFATRPPDSHLFHKNRPPFALSSKDASELTYFRQHRVHDFHARVKSHLPYFDMVSHIFDEGDVKPDPSTDVQNSINQKNGDNLNERKQQDVMNKLSFHNDGYKNIGDTDPLITLPNLSNINETKVF